MPSSAQQSPARHRGSWPAIVWIVLVEILVLVALSSAIVGYLNWSSEAAWAEFKAAGQLPAPQSSSPVQTVKAHAPCDRKA
jgi:flagellar basal body-associated protein FliL